MLKGSRIDQQVIDKRKAKINKMKLAKTTLSFSIEKFEPVFSDITLEAIYIYIYLDNVIQQYNTIPAFES